VNTPRTDKAWGVVTPLEAKGKNPRDIPAPMFKDWRYTLCSELESELINCTNHLLEALEALKKMACSPSLILNNEEYRNKIFDLIEKLEEVKSLPH